LEASSFGGLNQALYVSVDDLLGNAVPANQTTHSGSSDTQSAWKTLTNTPTYHPAVAVLAGNCNLLAIGGKAISKGGADMKEAYMCSPSTKSWIYISDLPAPRSTTAAAVLSSTEILVIGGFDGGIVNTMYKGTLHL
jgi:N-acetylneuraminic acid mutarotase